MFNFTKYSIYRDIEAAAIKARRDNDFQAAFGSRLVVMPCVSITGSVAFCILEQSA